MIAPQELAVGQTVTFEGYADDYGTRIVALQFSLDGGRTWCTHDVSDASADLWVHWTFAFTPERAGSYRLRVRSMNEEGRTSPASAVADFLVA